MKIAFLDRDDTIIKDYPDLEWAKIKDPDFFVDSIAALQMIQNKGYKIVIVTNQYLIGENIISMDDYNAFASKFLDVLVQNGIHVLDVFFCPHARSEACNCCKPQPGMIEAALRKYPEIDLPQSFVAGDSSADQTLAAYFNLPFYKIDNKGKRDNTMTLYQVAQTV